MIAVIPVLWDSQPDVSSFLFFVWLMASPWHVNGVRSTLFDRIYFSYPSTPTLALWLLKMSNSAPCSGLHFAKNPTSLWTVGTNIFNVKMWRPRYHTMQPYGRARKKFIIVLALWYRPRLDPNPIVSVLVLILVLA